MAWRLEPDVRWLAVDQAVIIFQRATREFVELDGSAAELWRVLVPSDWSPEAAVEFIVQSSATGRDEAIQIVHQFLRELASKRVLGLRTAQGSSGDAAS